MDNLTPTAQLTLEALRDHGPGNVHEVREHTGRSRSATDRAIAELATANLIVKLDGGDPAEGTPTRWQYVEPAVSETPTQDEAPDLVSEETEPAEPEPAEAEPIADTDSDGSDEVDGTIAEAEQPKLCRGCQAQMPRICPCCWQKTPAYCGSCRKTMPQPRRGEPGEPVILSNGLPKLRPGELEDLVLTVLRDQPEPNHLGVTGWTGGRVAIFLPGRSTGAINNALNKLTRRCLAELIGDQPMRFRLIPAIATGTAIAIATGTGTGTGTEQPSPTTAPAGPGPEPATA